MTKLEEVALRELQLNCLNDLQEGDREALQSKLDQLTSRIMSALTVSEICASVKGVYDATAGEYENNPHTKYIVSQLLNFMAVTADKAEILDIGCGHGRDALFMTCPDPSVRRSLMKDPTVPLPYEKTFNVVAVDGSPKLIAIGSQKVRNFENRGAAFPCGRPLFLTHDIHNTEALERVFGKDHFAGIWSCASIFTHTPRQLMEQAIAGLSELLRKDGTLFLSYTQRDDNGCYDKLLLSSTGRIKYFSHPSSFEIATLAAHHGLRLFKTSASDYEKQGQLIKKSLFTSQFFIKEA